MLAGQRLCQMTGFATERDSGHAGVRSRHWPQSSKIEVRSVHQPEMRRAFYTSTRREEVPQSVLSSWGRTLPQPGNKNWLIPQTVPQRRWTVAHTGGRMAERIANYMGPINTCGCFRTVHYETPNLTVVSRLCAAASKSRRGSRGGVRALSAVVGRPGQRFRTYTGKGDCYSHI